jgi:sugar phosphate isomerase/epimerase
MSDNAALRHQAPPPDRRAAMAAAAGFLGASAVVGTCGKSLAQPATATELPKLRYCLNTSTIRQHKLPLAELVAVAAKAGYDAIEPWIGELAPLAEKRGELAEMKKRIADAGLTVENAIGFAEWIVDDDARRKQGLERARRDMDLVRQIGGRRIAAPPAGATGQSDLNLLRAAERYRALIETGEKIGVVPQLEVWGFSKSLSRLGEVAMVAIESGHPAACLLPDVYHIYKGGSDFTGLRMLAGDSIHVLHMNDYPGDLPREKTRDADRVYPGDGVAPLTSILRTLLAGGFRGTLSLELFNPTYWKQDPAAVARTGLQKMQAAVQRALED